MKDDTTITRSQGPASEALGRTVDDVETLAPPVDIYETKDEFIVVADLPGVSPENVSVKLSGDRLEVEGQQALPQELVGFGAPVRFARSFVVPDSIDAAGVKATSEQGILTIRLKKAEARKPRQITVTAT
jgi:HSP20 family molecular chaperone IbpA